MSKTRTLDIGDYKVVLETPKHSQVMDAEKRATNYNEFGSAVVNQSDLELFTIAMAVKSVKKLPTVAGVKVDSVTETINNYDDALQFLKNLDEPEYRALRIAYAQLVDIRKYTDMLKNFEQEAKPVSSKTPSTS